MTTSAADRRDPWRVAVVLVTLVVCTLPFALRSGEESTGDLWTSAGPTMGTTFSTTASWPAGGPPQPPNELLLDRVTKSLAVVNEQMSTYDPESELSRFNRQRGDDWFPVSAATARVVGYSLELARDSGGAYDPTVGPLVNLWGFGPGVKTDEPPSDDALSAACENVGWSLVEARLEPPALRKSKPGVYLDLSSIAKGYGVDEVSRVLRDAGAAASMVEIGGEVVCGGAKPDGSPWRIGIEEPDSRTGRLLRTVVELRDEAVATSGDYRNFLQHDGVRYSHTIDPRTGRPVTHNTAAVTVRSADCMTADAYATALLVLGADAGYDWAKERGVAAMFVSRVAGAEASETPRQGYARQTTPAWDAKEWINK